MSTPLVVAGAALLLIGCSAGQSSTSSDRGKPQARRSGLAPLAEYEATLNPADFDQEVEAVQKQQAEERPTQPVDVPRETTSVAEQVVQGFRIQIFASSSIDDANAARLSAAEKFEADSVYIVYDAPVYKVRVGDFATRYEVNQRLPEFNEKGYRDAWVVPDRIVRRSPLKTPDKIPDER